MGLCHLVEQHLKKFNTMYIHYYHFVVVCDLFNLKIYCIHIGTQTIIYCVLQIATPLCAYCLYNNFYTAFLNPSNKKEI